jgi:hypothetical protein
MYRTTLEIFKGIPDTVKILLVRAHIEMRNIQLDTRKRGFVLYNHKTLVLKL